MLMNFSTKSHGEMQEQKLKLVAVISTTCSFDLVVAAAVETMIRSKKRADGLSRLTTLLLLLLWLGCFCAKS